jgi:hypothetical protein
LADEEDEEDRYGDAEPKKTSKERGWRSLKSHRRSEFGSDCGGRVKKIEI